MRASGTGDQEGTCGVLERGQGSAEGAPASLPELSPSPGDPGAVPAPVSLPSRSRGGQEMAADGWMDAIQPCAPAVPPPCRSSPSFISPLGFCFSPPFGACPPLQGCLRGGFAPRARLGSTTGPGSSPPPLPGCVLAPIKEQGPRPHPLPLTCGLLVPNPRLGVEGTDIECGPMGELMTEKGGPMPLMGELRVLMGEWS